MTPDDEGRGPDADRPGWAAPTPPPPAPAQPAAPAGFPAPPAFGEPFGSRPAGSSTRRRRRWPWVLGVLLAAIVALGVTGTVLFVQKIKPPIDAANQFLGDLERRSFDAAFAQLCTRDREEFSVDDIGTLFAVGFLDDYEVNPFDVDVDGDRARVSFDAEGTGDNDYFELPLRKEAGEWRPCLSDDADFSVLE
jgi:hypothetical protein